MKLGVCIPYRDNGDGVRKGHLDKLIPHLEKFLGEQGIDFTCYVGHQNDDGKFHRSGTKNIAYLEAKKDGCDYFAFHDVDMLPHDDCDYSHPGDTPKHIATYLSQWGYTLRDTEYFGGVVIFTGEQFENINGYNTDYVGWGMEDDDLYWRCVEKGYFVQPTFQEIKQKMVLSLDGKSTHIKINPSRELRRIPTDSFRIDIICKPEIPEHEPEHLIGKGNNRYYKYPILSKIGYDFGIDYNNSNAFATSMWDWKNNHIYRWRRRYQNNWTKVSLIHDKDKQTISFQINDEDLDEKFGIQQSTIQYKERLKRYGNNPFWLGCNDPKAWEGQRFFKGEIAEVKMWNQYDDLILHYDMTKSICCDQGCRRCKGDIVKDLSEFGNHGLIENRNIRFLYDKEVIKYNPEPHRRYGTMECMYHDDEGIVNNQFQGDVEQTTKNEILYRKKMQKGEVNIDTSGLNSMKYEIDSVDTIYNRHKLINVRF
ncbi:MAG: hypothetical protein CMD25_00240 [Flavobacteriales bacterium]|nr:hypothetical protein [Flavobacteriales bacterium]